MIRVGITSVREEEMMQRFVAEDGIIGAALIGICTSKADRRGALSVFAASTADAVAALEAPTLDAAHSSRRTRDRRLPQHERRRCGEAAAPLGLREQLLFVRIEGRTDGTLLIATPTRRQRYAQHH